MKPALKIFILRLSVGLSVQTIRHHMYIRLNQTLKTVNISVYFVVEDQTSFEALFVSVGLLCKLNFGHLSFWYNFFFLGIYVEHWRKHWILMSVLVFCANSTLDTFLYHKYLVMWDWTQKCLFFFYWYVVHWRHLVSVLVCRVNSTLDTYILFMYVEWCGIEPNNEN